MRWRLLYKLSLFALGVSALGATSCTVANPDFCCTGEQCAAKGLPQRRCTDPERTYCDNAGAEGTANVCIADPRATDCRSTEECTTPERPVCDADTTGKCIGCEDATDCGRFVGRPYCGSSGACVECRTDDDCTTPGRPTCGADGQCGGCSNHADCASGACDFGTGRCLDESAVVYVASSGSGTSCTRQQPCQTITAGVAAVVPARRFVAIAPGAYTENVTVDGKALTLAGKDAALTSTIAGALLTVSGTSDVTIDGMRLHDGPGNRGDAVLCMGGGSNSPRVAIRGGRIENNGGVGVNATRCSVQLERTLVSLNTGGGLSLLNGTFSVRNSFIVRNGGLASTFGGVKLDGNDGPTSKFEFNTVAGNAATGNAAGVVCVSATPQVLANNIVVGMAADQINPGTCSFSYTLSNESVSGTGNLTTQPNFVSAVDFHLQTGSPGVNAADPAATNATDFDGEPRPRGDRADIGADEVE